MKNEKCRPIQLTIKFYHLKQTNYSQNFLSIHDFIYISNVLRYLTVFLIKLIYLIIKSLKLNEVCANFMLQ